MKKPPGYLALILIVLFLASLVCAPFNVATILKPKIVVARASGTVSADSFLKSTSPFEGLSNLRTFGTDDRIEQADFVSGGECDELVIGLNSAPGAYAYVAGLVNGLGGRTLRTVTADNRVIALVVDVPSGAVFALKKQIYEAQMIRYVESNAKVQAQFVPNDEGWNLQWSPKKIEADCAWNSTIGSGSILVAVVDTGVDYTHPDLAANYVPLGYNWVNNNNDPLDDNGHGTHCAGIIAAILNNTVGIAGLAQVHVMAEKVLNADGMGIEDTVATGIIHAAEKGADIISMSLGTYSPLSLIDDAISYAYAQGVLLIAAAGNENSNSKLFPAAYDEVVAVAATDENDSRAWFSNWGKWIEVSAPGVNIYSTIPGGYAFHSGTSMACPHVSGVAALIWSQFPNATRDWVRAQLRVSADDLGEEGFDKYYGYGRINARKAVEQNPPIHDVMIFGCKDSEHFQPGVPAYFDVSVLDFGISDEENIILQFFENDSMIGSASIDRLTSGASATVDFPWIPLSEGTYNITFHVVPVFGEASEVNNVVTRMVCSRIPVGLVLFDGMRCLGVSAFGVWIENLTSRGYIVDSHLNGTIRVDSLKYCDVLVLPFPYGDYCPDEILAIQDFVVNGGGLLAVGSQYASFTSFAGIAWGSTSHSWPEYVHDITPHAVTEGVSSVYFGYTPCQLFVTNPAVDLVRQGSESSEVMLAVSEIGAGRVIALSSVNTISGSQIGFADNLQLANNMIDWLMGVKREHELAVLLEAPLDVEPNENCKLNVTVHNSGSANESDVELLLMIDNVLVTSIVIPELGNSTSYMMSYEWKAPDAITTSNITACASVALGEDVASNNVKTRSASVHHPLIHPVDGQWTHYHLTYFNASGYLQWTLFNNYTFENIALHKTKITCLYDDPHGNIWTDTMVVNTMNRFVESGSWTGMWFPIWAETNIGVGSLVRISQVVGEVEGSAFFKGTIDCWRIPYAVGPNRYVQLHDKTSGLMLDTSLVDGFGRSVDMFLVDTNIPIGNGISNVAIVTFTPAKTIIAQGYSTSLNARVENKGVHPGTSNLTIYVNSTVVASQVLELQIGDGVDLRFSWNTTGFAFGNYNITAELSPVPSEAITLDNILTFWVALTIPGDVTSRLSDVPDGIVDMRDIGALCNSFAKNPSSPGWNPNLDINEDGVVNMREIGIACSNFGKT